MKDNLDDSNHGKNPLVSIIIPAYNEALRLPASLAELQDFLAGCPFGAEVIVVDNGSTDGTAELALRIRAGWPELRLVQTRQRGKGLAVRLGLLSATGVYSLFCDADFSMPIPEIVDFLPPRLEGVELAIGTREGQGAKRVGEPLRRHLMGRAYNALVRRLTLPGIQDSQCGFKCVRADIGRTLASVLTIDGWGFDVEMLSVARSWGYRIVEVPIQWNYVAGSRVQPLFDSWTMTRDLLRVWWNLRAGRYGRRWEARAPETGFEINASSASRTSAPGSGSPGRLG